MPALSKIDGACGGDLMRRQKQELLKYRPDERLQIIFDDLDLSFTRGEIKNAAKICNAGGNAADVAEELGRDEYEAYLLCVWLWRGGKIGREIAV